MNNTGSYSKKRISKRNVRSMAFVSLLAMVISACMVVSNKWMTAQAGGI